MEREVVIRFAPPTDGGSADGPLPAEQVRGTVTVPGDPPRSFTGWLQLLGHLEVLSGVHRPDSHGE